jgi:hypothetical protein
MKKVIIEIGTKMKLGTRKLRQGRYLSGHQAKREVLAKPTVPTGGKTTSKIAARSSESRGAAFLAGSRQCRARRFTHERSRSTAGVKEDALSKACSK